MILEAFPTILLGEMIESMGLLYMVAQIGKDCEMRVVCRSRFRFRLENELLSSLRKNGKNTGYGFYY